MSTLVRKISPKNNFNVNDDIGQFVKVVESSDGKRKIARTVIIKNTPEVFRTFEVRNLQAALIIDVQPFQEDNHDHPLIPNPHQGDIPVHNMALTLHQNRPPDHHTP